jgi:hypothetical protein
MKETFITRITIDEAKKLEDLTDLDKLNSMSESEIEENALSDLGSQPLSLHSLEKIRRIKSTLNDRKLLEE